MAEETMQQQAAAIANAVSAVQPTQQFNLKSMTLKGTDVYAKMKPFSSNARDYASEKMAGEQYYLYRFNGTIVTVPTKFHQAYEKFDLLEVTLTGSINARLVADPNSAAGKKTVDTQAYGLDGYLTTDDEIAMLKIQKHRKTMEKAAKAIQKIDVTKELSEAELDELINQA